MQSTLKGYVGPLISLSLASVLLAGCAGDAKQGRGDSAAVIGAAVATPQSTGSAADGATSRAAGSSASSRPAGTQRVIILGTSLTAGLGLDPAQAYPTLLQRKADSAGFRLSIVNAGLSGETSAGALRRASWVLDQPAAAIVLEVGANDGLRGVNPDSTYANIVALVAVVKREQPAARVLLVQMEAPTNLGRDYTTRFHDAYRRAAAETGVPLLPFLLDGVAGNPRLNQADGIHPNVEGSKIVARTMWDAMRPTLESISAGTSPQ